MRRTETPEGRSVRLLRVGEQVRHVLSEFLQRGDVHDDTLAVHLVSVTEVRMSPDLRHATVFVKPLLGQDEDEVLKALRTHTAYLQREVARRVRTKYAAKLKFLADESFDEGSQIDRAAARAEGRAGPRRRMIDVERLAEPMTGDGCRAELFDEQASRRAQGRLRRGSRHLGDLCQQFRAGRLRRQHRRFYRSDLAQPHLRPVRRRRVRRHVDASSASTTAGSVLEIGGTYYRPHFRGTGFNRRVKDMMLRRAFDCGFRRDRIPRRRAATSAARRR